VGDRVLEHIEPELPGPRHHFRVDEEARGLGQDLRQRLPAEHLERAIDVSQSSSQQHSRQEVIAPREEATLPRILAIHPVTGHDGVGVREARQRNEFGEVELAIGVREGHEIEPSAFEARAQSGAITTVGGMADEPRMGTNREQTGDELRCAVGAAIVDDEHLEVVEPPGQRKLGFANRLDDDRFLIERRHHETDLIASQRFIHDRPMIRS
jgi:hypothetical protein